MSDHGNDRLFFDHLIDLPKIQENDKPARAMLEAFIKDYSEPLLGFIDFDQVRPFVEKEGLEVDTHLTPEKGEMYKAYQEREDYFLKASPYFGLVLVKKAVVH